MATITFDKSRFESQIQNVILKKMKKVFVKTDALLNQHAEVLKKTFADSDEFNSIKTKFKGEFGFTDVEIANLDRILTLLVPGGNNITVTKRKITNDEFFVSLEWVDFKQLKAHEFAQHELTRLDATGNIVEITDIISWVEWLEEGATVRGYQFFRPTGRTVNFSRSGEGLMRQSRSNFWTFAPTRVFERISKLDPNETIGKGFGILVRKLFK